EKRALTDDENRAYNFADLLRYSSALGFGSDAPIESLNPCLGIYSAIARKPKLDSNQPGWRLDQSLGLTQALDAYTLGAAKLSQSSHIRGKIETNYYADLIVFEDYLEQEQEYWLEASPELVICAGEIVEITRQF
ncbi:MAG TPA: amidohydrolase family protein, partial [Candidatus Cloacimonadota bacterium]|nr:amidohydrolase family protein [Candidatus Cloacimonadota bacterium]